jgi:hypothetical protein
VNPEVPAAAKGRSEPMGYIVTPRIDFDDAGENVTYYSVDRRTIIQDQIDKCRQEYIDIPKAQLPERDLFQLPPSPYYDGSCGAYIMLPATIAAYDATVSGVEFNIRITSAYQTCPVKLETTTVALDTAV